MVLKNRPYYHVNADEVRALLGGKTLATCDGEERVNRIFFDMIPHAVSVEENSVVAASLDPVAPFHVLAFPQPGHIGAMQDANGDWRNLPEDGGFIHIEKQDVANCLAALASWMRESCQQTRMPAPAQSVFTANLGAGARLTVPLLHIHHLMAFDEQTYDQLGDENDDTPPVVSDDTQTFARPHEGKPEDVLRQAYKDKHGSYNVAKLREETPDFSLPLDAYSIAHETGIRIERGQSVKRNDFALNLSVDADMRDLDIRLRDVAALAYDIQQAFVEQGATGFTMTMEVTPLQNPDRVVYDADGRIPLRMHFVTHAQGDPEWLKGGYVYAWRQNTAPNSPQMTL